MRNFLFFVLALLIAVPSSAQSRTDDLVNMTPQPAPAQKPADPQKLPIDQANAKQARDVLDKTIAALGGDKYLSVRDIAMNGRSSSFYREQSQGSVVFWRFQIVPDKDRFEATKQRDVIYTYRGDQGWETTFRGTKKLEQKVLDDYLRQRKHSLDNVLRFWSRDPKVALFYDGKTLAEAQQAHQITLLNGDNEAVTLYIDTLTNLPIKKSFTYRVPGDREKFEEYEVYGLWRSEQGVSTPHVISRFKNGERVSQRFLEKVTYNSGVSEGLFQVHEGTTQANSKR